MTKTERLVWMLVFTFIYGWSVWADGQSFGRIVLFAGCAIILEVFGTISRRFAHAWYRPRE